MSKGKRKKIMIVDDDKEFLEELKETLTLNEYDTVAFSDGISALKMVDKIKPDVILLDLKMEGKSGFEVAAELKQCPETTHIPVVAMTAFYTEQEHVILMRMCGIARFLIKPFNPGDVIEQIEAVLQERTRFKEKKNQNKNK